MYRLTKSLLLFSACAALGHVALGQNTPAAKPPAAMVAGIPVNYDEDKVGNYTLPDVLTMKNGQKVTDKQTWLTKRRPEIVKLFEENQYGTMPGKPAGMRFNVFDKGTPVFGGGTIRKQVTVYFTKDTTDQKMDILMYLPAKSAKPVPLLLMISFSPNSSMSVDDPGVKQGTMWDKNGKKVPAPKMGLGSMKKELIERVTGMGYGIATIYYGDIEPDFKTGYKYGIIGKYMKPGQTIPGDSEWGAISAWSWGLSRAMDYLETDKQIDANRVALHGVSRLGKTVLWTGAHDTRFKAVLASCSGEGGAALSRRNYGENLAHMSDTSRYFYQFAAQWHKYAGDFNLSPVDAHMLVALMAPRSLLLQTGDTDLWSDPHGEFLSAVSAQPVYNLFGLQGPGNAPWPAAKDASLAYNPLGYFMHQGGHGTVPSDWDIYLEYLKKFL
ncbi:acetylxylan esterase [Mucilaginibacter mali]|uniref:Acetylxylan esterase n=1 Tax=Mucilaginibacter mali TaxID=2740462 RepID=A0A7D4Q1C2_9SPHI|nr:acetylxylan esterase [Mucilaginibacter mali]QKJ28867.1 acetylxylan esterase [Mucilaginibacter mali]